MKRIAIVLGLAAVVMSCARKDWRDASLTAEERASLLLKEMTLEEKVGQMCQYVAPCYVEPGKGSARKNIDATDENLGNKDLSDKVRRGEVGAFLHVMTSTEAGEPAGDSAAAGDRRDPRERADRRVHGLSYEHQHGFHFQSGTDGEDRRGNRA